MGLDQWFYIRNENYVSQYTTTEPIKYPKDMPTYGFKSINTTIDYEAGYLRKANAIQYWIEDNLGVSTDVEIPINYLKELVDICVEILEDNSKASELLPTMEGFFFGGTEYDDYYYYCLKETIKFLVPIINFIEQKHKDGDYDWTVVYKASW